MMHAALPTSPACERNKAPILEILRQWINPRGRALEIASGTGQHVAHFAAALRRWHWQPSDLDDALFEAIRLRCGQMGLSNGTAPVCLDVRTSRWTFPSIAKPTFDLIYCTNMLHITPWECCTGLMQGAARHLAPQGLLVTYGPYLENDVPTAPGNLAFDADLRQRNPAWGIRHLDDVRGQAEDPRLQLAQRVTMPANNLLLAFGRKSLEPRINRA